MFIIAFFRDMHGIWYVLWVTMCVFLQFVLLGIVGDRKRQIINADLLAKRKIDIESGKVAEEAAKATKQVLDVMTEEELRGEEPTEPTTEKDLTKKEEAPQTLVIGADGSQIEEKK